jgi:hypothetical protein
MAIKGAFQAGLVKGFATSLQEGIKERQERMDKLIDNQMDAVRRSAPKLAKSMAEATNAKNIMREMKAEFGVTDEEFVALAQTYDINAVYGAIQKAQANLPEGSKLDKSKFLGSLNIPKGLSLPEGVTAEQAVESIYLGYARNINQDPNNKSEVHKTKSWGKALKDTLMLDPRASAEDQLNAMSYMGMPVQEILQYEATSGQPYTPLEGVERVRGFDIEVTDYKESDFMSTSSAYERAFTRTFAGTDDLANVTDMTGALEAMGAQDETELGNKLRKGGTAMAELELQLAQSGVDSTLTRDRALIVLSNEVNTSAEMDTLLKSVESGLASELINESLQKHGKLTDEYIEYILTGNKPTEGGGTDDRNAGPRDLDADMGVGRVATDDLEATATPAPVSTGDETVDAILANASKEETIEEDEFNPEALVAGNAASVAQRNEETVQGFQDAASKVTYAEYEAMSDAEKREAGLPTRGIDAAAAFGVLNPKQYFKGGAGEINVGEITEDTETEQGSTALADAAMNAYEALQEELPDMSVLEGEDGKQIIKDWMKQNNIPVNETLIRLIQMQLPTEE